MMHGQRNVRICIILSVYLRWSRRGKGNLFWVLWVLTSWKTLPRSVYTCTSCRPCAVWCGGPGSSCVWKADCRTHSGTASDHYVSVRSNKNIESNTRKAVAGMMKLTAVPTIA